MPTTGPTDTFARRKVAVKLPRRRVLGLLGASLTSFIGWGAEEGLGTVKGWLFPDDYQLRAEAVRADLSEKSNAIRQLADQMAQDLSDMREGSLDEDTLEQLLGKADELVRRSDDLRPSVTMASDFAGGLAEVRAASKAGEIARLGYSTRADFLLNVKQAVTLCAEHFTFGISGRNSSGSLDVRLAYRDDSDVDPYFEAGESVIVQSDRMRATVTYMGALDNDGDTLEGFGLECDQI